METFPTHVCSKIGFRGGGKYPFWGFDILAAVEGFLIPRTRKVLRKRVSGINAIDRMLRMVARLLLVAEIEQFEDSPMRIVGFHWSSQFSYVILY